MSTPTLTVTPAYGVSALVVGAASRAVAARQFAPVASTLDLTVAVVTRALAPASGCTVTLTATRVDTGATVAAVTALAVPALPDVAGFYRVTLPPTALPAGAYRVRAVVTGPDGVAETTTDLVLDAARAGVSGLAAPLAVVSAGTAPRWRRPIAGGLVPGGTP